MNPENMISIIVPVYKVEPYLRQCVDSILNQTYSDLEVLLIDDGSPDKCGEICDEYAAADSRVRVIHKLNGGISSARNAGLDAATGEYIGFVDSDDWIEPRMFEVLLNALTEADADISICDYWLEYASGREIACGFTDRTLCGYEVTSALVQNEFGNTVWNKLFRKHCWLDIRFPLFRKYEDVATVYRTILSTETITVKSNPLYHYRKRAGSITTTPSMDNLADQWFAYFVKYECLNSLVSKGSKNKETMKRLRTEIAYAAVRPFRWIYRIPVAERDTELLKTVSRFLRDNFKVVGERGWKPDLRLAALLSRRTNEFAYAMIYFLNWVYKCGAKISRKKDLYP